ncbi:hypothetical protein [Pseudomonas fluorescens]|uniref:hypothetical protein n=1 Tax=Pseudomonas fluorescens TaxID=294 RepID=UPI0010E130C1|nr:hypothetical protein [Pseudomonas fluorescens]TCV62767.1 hypothetical protein EDB98_11275 [Pseudomonas fluorescens]
MKYFEWEGEVIEAVADAMAISHSDASSIVEAKQFYMQQSWGKGMDAQQTATKIMTEALQQPCKLNPLEEGRTEPEFFVQFLEQLIDAKLSAEKKTLILAIISDLPKGAGMRDLYEAIKVQEAASLGITPEQYETLSPVIDALQWLLSPSAYNGLFEQPADV